MSVCLRVSVLREQTDPVVAVEGFFGTSDVVVGCHTTEVCSAASTPMADDVATLGPATRGGPFRRPGAG